MSLWEYVKEERNKIFTNAAVATVAFFVALVGNSYVDDWKESRVVAATLAAIRAEAHSNELAYTESFAPLFQDGLVLREFTLATVTQALSNPSFTKHATPAQVQILSAYARELSLANAYRSKAELIRFNPDYFTGPKKSTLKTWEIPLIQSWGKNLEKCRVSIEEVASLK